MEEPVGDPIVFPTYILSKNASKNMKFVLTGDGADELLEGYLFQRAIFYLSIYKKLIPYFLHNYIFRFLFKLIPKELYNIFFIVCRNKQDGYIFNLRKSFFYN